MRRSAKTTKKAARGLPFAVKRDNLLGGLGRAFAGIALLELVHAAGGIDDLLLARVERVRFGRDLDLVDRILLAVLPGDGLVRGDGGARHETEVAAGIQENDFAII